MRNRVLLITPEKAPDFVESFNARGSTSIESISVRNQGTSVELVTEQAQGSRVMFEFDGVSLLKVKEKQTIHGVLIEFQEGLICVDFDSAATLPEFVIHAKSLRCTIESRC